MISKLRPTEFKVRSLTTIATPHQGLKPAEGSSWQHWLIGTTGSVIADHFMEHVNHNGVSKLQFYGPYAGIVDLA
jgi:hypothetical protein